MQEEPLYDPQFVQRLFDEMAATYGLVNLASSFGFSRRWRRQCVRKIEIQPAFHVIDLMSGMGEFCPDVSRQVGTEGKITAIDISPVMCQRAKRYEKGKLPCEVIVLAADALCTELPAESADAVISSFGLKTFSDAQIERLAIEVHRIRKPGASFSFIEISVPTSIWLRGLYMFYLKRVIPLIGRMMMGNPENYRLLGVYTAAFGNCDATAEHFRNAGLNVNGESYFFGCATGVVGCKPSDEG